MTSRPATRRPPLATYRLQLQPAFGFDAAAEIVDYLAELGVSHLYSSPYLQAAPGSTHGYDVVDPERVNTELGGEAGLQRLRDALRQAGMGEVLDIVPNHVAADPARNRWWRDVLQHGPGGRFAHFFDIDWDACGGKLVLPVLGRELEEVLESGELGVGFEAGEGTLRYYEHTFPLAPGSWDPAAGAAPADLRVLLERQHYLLMFWRRGLDELNYRRFFDITGLVGVRVEEPDVFAATHALPLEWLRTGALDGVRIDHPDGLRDPLGYLARLRQAAPDAWLVVEKILEPHESLPEAWPVAGTTGYDFMNSVLSLFVDGAAAAELDACYRDFATSAAGYTELVVDKKEQVAGMSFQSDIKRLARCFAPVAAESGLAISEGGIYDLLEAALVSFPVYRTYVRPEEGMVSSADASNIHDALERARALRHDTAAQAFELLEHVLLLRARSPAAAEFVARFQQMTGPLMAKGVEDTAFYCFNRFVALNEVGGDPARMGIQPDEFHQAMSARQQAWPAAMSATATHDTKRGEDVRARLAVLSEVPQEWREAVVRWSAHNEEHRRGGLPDRNAEYLFYQTLVGAHPLSVERAQAYMLKAARESKEHTSWLDADARYESELTGFVARCSGDASFMDDVAHFVDGIVDAGWRNALAQKLIALTAPGVPDLYQGSELWELSLVDPDNRRPVDFELRRRLLREARLLTAGAAWERRRDGLPKLLCVAAALSVRARNLEAFESGAYEPLPIRGPEAAHALAFCRGKRVVTLVPRFTRRTDPAAADAEVPLPAGSWRDAFTNQPVDGGWQPVAGLLAGFPVALLERVA